MKKSYGHAVVFVFGLALLFMGVSFSISVESFKISEAGSLLMIGAGLTMLTSLAKRKTI